jgi:hypothetical protein
MSLGYREEQHMDEPPMMETPGAEATGSNDIAFRLLQLQQRLDAWDRLYNEEIIGLRQDLAQLKADYLRQRQAQEQQAKPRRPRRIRSAG